MANGHWRRWEFVGSELTGKTLGIIGIGRIGTEVARRTRALGMDVRAYDPYVSAHAVRDRGARKVSWNTLLSESDFITIHTPLTEETRHLMGGPAFRMMKQTAILINTARGAIIEEHALLDVLKKGRIQTAALDVYPEEPLGASSPLRKYASVHANLILTPHIAATTREAIDQASMRAAEAVRDFFKPRR